MLVHIQSGVGKWYAHTIFSPSLLLLLSFSDSKLVPDLSTEIGKEVSKWRKILDSVPVESVTFGILYYPDLTASGYKIPWGLRYLKKSKTGKFEIITSLLNVTNHWLIH